jgi:hypothetical protein
MKHGDMLRIVRNMVQAASGLCVIALQLAG